MSIFNIQHIQSTKIAQSPNAELAQDFIQHKFHSST